VLTRLVLQQLAQVRLDDSILLFQANRSSSAYYLAGYAIELGLKACISKLVQPDTIPEKAFINAVYTHKLESLLSISGLKPQFDIDAKTDPQFAASWAIVNNWSEDSRYEVWDPISTGTLIQAIRDPAHGVFQWVKKHW
jgi:hypothetical protein